MYCYDTQVWNMAFFRLKLSLFFLVLHVVQGKALCDCDGTLSLSLYICVCVWACPCHMVIHFSLSHFFSNIYYTRTFFQLKSWLQLISSLTWNIKFILIFSLSCRRNKVLEQACAQFQSMGPFYLGLHRILTAFY